MSWFTAFSRWFATPGRQAGAWTALGIAGFVLGGAGLLLITGGGDGTSAARVDGTPTAGAILSPSPTPGRTATPSPTQESPTTTPTPSATPTPAVSPTATSTVRVEVIETSTPEPTPEPATPAATATATPPPAGQFCNTITDSAPPTRIFGLITVGGEKAPLDVPVTVLFNGVAGANATRPAVGSYVFEFAMAPEGCVNRPGAAISFYVGGEYVDTGFVLTPGEPGFRVDIAVE